MNIKTLVYGIICILIVGVGGFLYRSVLEHPTTPVACPVDARVCPDGTAVGRTGPSCSFAICPPPNISLSSVGITYAVPEGFVPSDLPDAASIAAYVDVPSASTSAPNAINIRRFAVDASSTPLSTIQQTAIGVPSGLPVSATSFSSTVLGSHRFTVVKIERFEGTIDVAYYLARTNDVLRFDAIDRNTDWTNPILDTAALPAHTALRKLLSTLQGGE